MFKTFKPNFESKVWKFVDPDTGYHYESGSRKSLLALIKKYRENNKLPDIEYLTTVVNHYLCGLPQNAGLCQKLPKLKRGLVPTIRGGIALIRSYLSQKFVEQNEADARSETCLTCPHNIFPDKGAFILWSDDLAKQSVGDRRAKFHDNLGNCEICSCPLRPKVWYDKSLIKLEKKVLEKLPDFCWQKKIILEKE